MGQASEMALASLLETEKLRGKLPQDTPVQVITAYLMSVSYGLTVLAQRGKTKAELKSVAEMAVQTLPGMV